MLKHRGLLVAGKAVDEIEERFLVGGLGNRFLFVQIELAAPVTDLFVADDDGVLIVFLEGDEVVAGEAAFLSDLIGDSRLYPSS